MNKNSLLRKVLLMCGCVAFIISCNKDINIQLSVPVTDVDGNVYKTIIIGSQTWMAENLKTTRYNNGDTIATTTPATLSIYCYVEVAPFGSCGDGKYQWAYDGDENNVTTYGRLYTNYAAIDSRGICPTGWHLPTNEEWETLAKKNWR